MLKGLDLLYSAYGQPLWLREEGLIKNASVRVPVGPHNAEGTHKIQVILYAEVIFLSFMHF